ncbi:Oxygen-independent coproporphyrinogen-III oxidase 1 [Flavimaricola marinus]|uniref:Heme chaperone HemW n=1 Tax=Flavimaricola marinus TaxID=1819565 RepID=A0A238LBS6_9RHOB|nr:radical SAM family heme chaperone HemW [Flavimaricola marinus]SMY07187.1 Oxygen-independent coproporphyrinogen-III oxidase 1 [Flavimaricola marinus]
MPDLTDHWRDGGFGLYVHWPFCQSKCPYCDFNSHVVAQIDQNRWAEAYVSEIRRVAGETPGRVMRSVFFGGGTPSLMEPFVVQAVLNAVRDAWPMANDVEITLEANPTSVEATRFAGYRDAGVNRVSMGVQALNDPDLKALGRLHSVADAMAAFEVARDVFDRVSFDLIYARQGQTVEAWRDELRQALDMAVDHLSLYQLTIEDGTAFGDRFAAGRLRGLPDEDRSADMWEVTQEVTAAAGFSSYEVSNHAKDGCESRHNLIYWQGGDYVGIGPGAHGRVTLDGVRFATEAPKAPLEWLRRVATLQSGEDLREPLTREDHVAEFLMMGLRLREGVRLDRLEALAGDSFDFNINALREIGMIETDDRRLWVTEAGRPVLNAVLRRLLGA